MAVLVNTPFVGVDCPADNGAIVNYDKEKIRYVTCIAYVDLALSVEAREGGGGSKEPQCNIVEARRELHGELSTTKLKELYDGLALRRVMELDV